MHLPLITIWISDAIDNLFRFFFFGLTIMILRNTVIGEILCIAQYVFVVYLMILTESFHANSFTIESLFRRAS